MVCLHLAVAPLGPQFLLIVHALDVYGRFVLLCGEVDLTASSLLRLRDQDRPILHLV